MNTTKAGPGATNRKTAIVTGVLFIIATIAGPVLAGTLTPAMTGTDYLARFSESSNQVAGAALLYLIAAFACAGIAISLYPVLKAWSVGLALGSVVFRTLEAAFYMIEIVCLLSLLTLGQQFAAAGAADGTLLQAIGDLLVGVREYAGLVGVFAFCLGACMYYTLFFRSRLIPRWLSGWGIVAIILMTTACVLALFSGNLITSYIPLAAPLALQELVLGVWLIVKGFNSSTVAAPSAKTTSELLGAA